MNKCPLCASTENELLYTNSRGGKYLENYVCNSCGFVYTYPRLSNEEINRLYLEGGFSQEARKSVEPDIDKFVQTESWALERMHMLEKKLPNFFKGSKSCLEIGCGTGSFLWLLKGRGHEVVGIEPDAKFVNVAKARYNITIKSILFQDYPKTDLFDLICSFHVIEHIIDPREFVKEMYARIKNDGYIFIECPSIDSIYTNDLDTFFWDVHVNTFSNLSLPWLLETEGFSVLDIAMFKGFVSVIAQKGTEKKFNKDDKSRIKKIIRDYSSPRKKNKIVNTIWKIGRMVSRIFNHN